MKTIIAGTRTLTPQDTAAAIAACPWQITAVVCGEARGPDTHGKEYAHHFGLPVHSHPADWNGPLGKGAGFARNEDMAHEADALVAVWDGQSNGTRHMVEYMQSLGKPVHVWKCSIHAPGVKLLLGHEASGSAWWGDATEVDGMHVDQVGLDELPAGTVIENVGLGQSTVRPSMDFETYSEAGFVIVDGKVKGAGGGSSNGLGLVGTGVYAEHPSTEVLCLYYDLKDGKGRRGWWPGLPQPADLLNHVANGGEVEAFNSTFEFFIWNFVCVRKYGWPELRIEQTYCVMSMSRRWGLPGSLANAAKALGAEDKDKAGKNLIQKLCRPHTPTKSRPAYRRTMATHWDDFQGLFKYCDQDVATEDDVKSRIPDLTPYERDVWLADQRINLRGVLVDRPTLSAGLRLLQDATAHYTAELQQITQGAVNSVGEVAKMTAWLAGRGVHMPDMTSGSVSETLAMLSEDNGLSGPPADCVRVLEIRQTLSSANVKKLAKLSHQLNSDGRLRNQYMYCGAERTGRWSSSAADDNASNSQLQNITAKGPDSRECEACGRIFGAVLDDCPSCGSFLCHDRSEWTVEAVEFAAKDIRELPFLEVQRIWGNPVDLLCGCLRGLFIAKTGHDFICCDFSAVEAVALACLSRCQWRIDVFSTHGKIYEMSASKITGIPFEEMMQYKKDTGMHHPSRKKIGKVAELACFGPHTQVLTKRGYVRIVEVTKNDYLWDGVEWVTSDGVIAKGERPVLELDGVQVTPDHPVSLGSSWKEARLLVSNKNTLAQALAIGSANLPSCAMKSAASAGGACAYVHAGPNGMSTCVTYLAESLRAALNVGARKAARLTSSFTQSTPTSAPIPSTAVDWLTGCVPQLRGATRRAVRATKTTAVAASVFAKIGAEKTAQAVSSSTSSLWTGGTSRTLKWTDATPMETTNLATSGSSLGATTCSTSGALSKCSSESTTSSDVYDIVNAGPRHRFTIKTDSGHLIVHNSGYGGWVGAWCAFGADQFMDEAEIKKNVLAWRAESPEVVEFWGGQFRQTGPRLSDGHPEYFGLEGAAVQAVLYPGQQFWANDISYGVHDGVLYCRLPSGRLLAYHDPQLVEVAGKWGKPNSYSLTFMGFNTNPKNGPRGWVRMETYGGRLAENVTQAVCADIQAEAILRAEAAGYPVVMHTHDELCAEVPEGFGSVDELCAVMGQAPAWASWWPLKAAGWRHKRYQKD